MSKTRDAIEQLGTEIVGCAKECQGVIRNQREGYYPRAFFLDPADSSEVEVAIIGRNPGFSTAIEREFYKILAQQHKDKKATYKDCLRVWRAIASDHQYFLRPRHLLHELGLATSNTALLWAEVVFCESARQRPEDLSPPVPIPTKTLEICTGSYLRRILQERLVPNGSVILCLGNDAFHNVRQLVGDDNRWKVIRVYHPTGSRTFANYFDKAKEPEAEKMKITERHLKSHLKKDFRKHVGDDQNYVCEFEPSGVERLD